MAALNTPVCNFGESFHPFQLKGTDEKVYTFEDVRGAKGTIVMFVCNHCPYVKAIVDRIVADVSELKKHGIGAIAIMSNDTRTYPEDSFENMKEFALNHNFDFPYVIDETQEVAKAYGAVCTPDFFGYNAKGELHYRGRLDSSGMKPAPNAKRELLEAMIQIAETGQGPQEQNPSVGCSIKWSKSLAA